MTRVIIGLNNAVGARFLDEVKGHDAYKSDNIIEVEIQPNILAEIALSERWLVFAGATQTLELTAGDGDRDDDTSELEIEQRPTDTFFAGVRYQKANWALEAQVSDNPFAAFAGDNILFQIGGFIYF
jgi:hypothetical protein